MPNIFICYRHEDTPFEAAWIRDQLVSHFGENKIFLDIDAIPKGKDFRREIDEKVGNCDYLLAVIGKFWLAARDENGGRRLDNSDDWVRLEIQAALNRSIPVIPVLLHNVGMPKPDELPKDLSEFAYRQAHSIHLADRQHDIDKLIDDVNQQERERFEAKKRAEERSKREEVQRREREAAELQKARQQPVPGPPSNRVLGGVSLSLGLMAILVLISSAIELSRIGGSFLLAANQWQQSFISAPEPKIAIVDISHLQPVSVQSSGTTRLVTPRDKLQGILEAIAEYEPAAIGVNVNFAPDEGGQPQTPDDDKFFNACLQMTSRSRRHVPVFLGLADAVGRQPQVLMDNPQFRSLFASIGICDDTRILPLSFDYRGIRCNSLCTALAATTATSDSTIQLPPPFGRSKFEMTCGREPTAGFLVDYSSLGLLESRVGTLRSIDPTSIRDVGKTIFRGKLVFVGDAEFGSGPAFDVYTRLGRPPVPGVYLQACGADTLLNGLLFQLSIPGRLLVGALLLVLIVTPLTLMQDRRWRLKASAVRLLLILSAYSAGAVAIISMGIYFRSVRVVWVDCYLLLVVLFAHFWVLSRPGPLLPAAEAWKASILRIVRRSG